MTDSSTETAATTAGSSPAGEREPFPKWKLVLCIAAGAMVLIGGLLSLIDGGEGTAPMQARSGGPTSGAASSFIGQSPEGPSGTMDPGESGSESSWSPGLLRMGFSFFVGFAMGLLMRMFLRVTFLVAGGVFLVLAGLSYVEFITVNWETMETAFSGFVDRIGEDFDHIRTVLTGSLPQAGLGGLGLVAGFKKR